LDINIAEIGNNISLVNVDSDFFYKNFGRPDTILKNRGRLYSKESREILRYDVLVYKDARFAILNGKVSLIKLFFDSTNHKIMVDDYILDADFNLEDASLTFPCSFENVEHNRIFRAELGLADEANLSRWDVLYLDDGDGGIVTLYFYDGMLRRALFDNPKL